MIFHSYVSLPEGTGIWLLVDGLEHGFYDFPFSWEFHHPNWRSHIFQRDWNHQPDNVNIYIYDLGNYYWLLMAINDHYCNGYLWVTFFDLTTWPWLRVPWLRGIPLFPSESAIVWLASFLAFDCRHIFWDSLWAFWIWQTKTDTRHLAFCLAFDLSYIRTFYLASYLASVLAVCWHLFWRPIWYSIWLVAGSVRAQTAVELGIGFGPCV